MGSTPIKRTMEIIIVYKVEVWAPHSEIPDACGIFSSLEKAKEILIKYAKDNFWTIDSIDPWKEAELNQLYFDGKPSSTCLVWDMNLINSGYSLRISAEKLNHLVI